MDAAGVWHEGEEDEENTNSGDRKITGSQIKHKRYHRLADDTQPAAQNRKKKSTKVRKSIIKSPTSPVKKKTHSVLENEDSDDEGTSVSGCNLPSGEYKSTTKSAKID